MTNTSEPDDLGEVYYRRMTLDRPLTAEDEAMLREMLQDRSEVPGDLAVVVDPRELSEEDPLPVLAALVGRFGLELVKDILEQLTLSPCPECGGDPLTSPPCQHP